MPHNSYDTIAHTFATTVYPADPGRFAFLVHNRSGGAIVVVLTDDEGATTPFHLGSGTSLVSASFNPPIVPGARVMVDHARHLIDRFTGKIDIAAPPGVLVDVDFVTATELPDDEIVSGAVAAFGTMSVAA